MAHLFNVQHLRPKESPGQDTKAGGITGGEELVLRCTAGDSLQIMVTQCLVNVFGCFFGAGYQCHGVSHDVGDHPRQQWVVCAAKDQRVHTSCLQGCQIFLAVVKSSGPAVMPDSTNRTKSGQATEVILRSGAAAKVSL